MTSRDWLVIGGLAIFVASGTWAAQESCAADLPVKVLPLPGLESYSPLYLSLFAGGGWSQVQNELTIAGTAMGPVKVYPTGVLVGSEIGARWNFNPIVYGFNASIAYNFGKSGVGCDSLVAPGLTGNQCLGQRKDGLLFQQGGELGINLATLFGYNASVSQAQNWPVRLPVPSSIWSNVIVTARGGIAERDLTLCATALDAAGNAVQPCSSKYVIGPYVGGKIGAALSQQIEAYVRIDHIFWNSSFTPVVDSAVAAVSANTTKARDETLAVAGVAFHF